MSSEPYAFNFETARDLVRLLKKNRNGEFQPDVETSYPQDTSENFVWAYVPSSITGTYDATVKAWQLVGATLMFPMNIGQESTGKVQWGKVDEYGVINGGITATIWVPNQTGTTTAPVVGAGFYLGKVFALDGSGNPRVLIAKPPASSASSGGGTAVIDVVTDVQCGPEGLTLSTVTFSGADYDNAVIRNFLALNDVTQKSYTANQGRVVKVNDAATGLEFGPIIDASYTTFIALSDTPSVYGSNPYKVLTVASGSTSIVFSANNVTTKNSIAGGGNPNDPAYVSLSLVNDETSPGNNRVYGTTSAGVKGYRTLQLTALTDFPSTTGHGGKFVKVNSGGTGLQYTAVDIQAMLDAITDLTARVVALEGA